MAETDLPAETEVTLLLCGSLQSDRSDPRPQPLNVREFNDLLRVLRRLSISLSELLSRKGQRAFRTDLEGKALYEGRIGKLLDRRDELNSAVVRWQGTGIWTVDRNHPDYPERYRRLLADRAPPLLFGAGDVTLLNAHARRVAVVGSRDIDRRTSDVARSAGLHAARHGTTVVSGGARGVDRTAVDAALEHGGSAIVVLPGELARVLTVPRYHTSIDEGRLALVSPYPPEEAFSDDNALGRNRLIYCLGDVALVVRATEGTGGTWSGASEALRRGWVPLYAYHGSAASDGNQALIELGAHPFPHDAIGNPDRFAAWLEASTQESVPRDSTEPGSRQLGLFPDC